MYGSKLYTESIYSHYLCRGRLHTIHTINLSHYHTSIRAIIQRYNQAPTACGGGGDFGTTAGSAPTGSGPLVQSGMTLLGTCSDAGATIMTSSSWSFCAGSASSHLSR